ncbi:MAG: hypothetical protein LBU60_03435 [Clostridiales bacterium]|jgi:hypothetical protein|nr:hypothetical protein [Clostridiales bacterium]
MSSQFNSKVASGFMKSMAGSKSVTGVRFLDELAQSVFGKSNFEIVSGIVGSGIDWIDALVGRRQHKFY